MMTTITMFSPLKHRKVRDLLRNKFSCTGTVRALQHVRIAIRLNRRPAEHCCGQIWRGVVSDVILIPTIFLQVRETRSTAPVDCDMVLHRNSIVICWA